ncbi:hypothetical protein ACFL96_01570 [Thermoproteota archaeon]
MERNLKQLVTIFSAPNPDPQEMELALASLNVSMAWDSLEPKELADWFYGLRRHVIDFLEQFNKYSFPKEFGFEPYELKDILAFFINDEQFNFSLKKAKGKGLLYSCIHTSLRRKLINDLPKPIRLAILIKKIKHYTMLSKMQMLLEVPDLNTDSLGLMPQDYSAISDIVDIGMGHSVYLIEIKISDTIQRKVVVKQEELSHQAFFCRLLRSVEWPTYQSIHIQGGEKSWEISEYLDGNGLFSALHESPMNQREHIEIELARYAALGDVLGWGDRHFENYIYYQGEIYALDIAYLFWEGNEDWLKKYISGGLSEFPFVIDYQDQKRVFINKIKEFYSEYAQTITNLSRQRTVIESLIKKFYGEKQPDTQRKIAYIQKRLIHPIPYINQQKKMYIEALNELQYRQIFKQVLVEIAKKDLTILEKDPLLKMYYLADQERYSAFFLLEDKKDNLFQRIKELAGTTLGYTPDYFKEKEAEIYLLTEEDLV